MITYDLIEDYVEGSDGKCWFESGWEFEWGETSAPKKSGNHIGYGGEGWNTFGPTNEEGKAEIKIDHVEGRQYFWMREVLQEGYIPFSDSEDGSESVSAEMLAILRLTNMITMIVLIIQKQMKHTTALLSMLRFQYLPILYLE